MFEPTESYIDVNANGVYDSGEPYNDANNNGTFDAIETFTDSNGNGTYDFGEAYIDANNDSTFDAGEPGIFNVPVLLYTVGADGIQGTADDVLYATTYTDANGNFIFSNIPIVDVDGNEIVYFASFPYSLVWDGISGNPTVSNVSGGSLTDNLDSDINSGATTINFTLGAGTTSFDNIGAGYYGLTSLSVSLTNLIADARCETVELQWTITNESNINFYRIERSDNAINWIVLQTQAALGSTGGNYTYTFTDEYRAFNTTYYRIIMMNADGSERVSQIIAAKTTCDETVEMHIYPVPANNVLNYDLTVGVEADIIISIIDELGREHFAQKAHVIPGVNKVIIDISRLADGVYFTAIKGTINTKYVKFKRID